MKILIVDDDPISRELLYLLIEKANISNVSVKIVYDGEKAVNICEKEYFDLIFMDIEMPILDGFNASKIIKGRNDNIIIIAVACYDKSYILQKYKESGFDDYIQKPINQNLIEKALKKMVLELS